MPAWVAVPREAQYSFARRKKSEDAQMATSNLRGRVTALSTENTDATAIHTPVVVYIVHHPECAQAEWLAARLFRWFRLGDLPGDAAAAGLPVYYRRQQKENRIQPEFCWQEADLNVILLLVDDHMVVDAAWRGAVIALTKAVSEWQGGDSSQRPLLLPVALHGSFYQLRPLYEHFNPVNLLNLTAPQMEAALRRAATEAITRRLRGVLSPQEHPPPLNVFLSHAKRDGTHIAEQLRDGVRSFGQLVAWYDANDLSYGGDWASPMQLAVSQGTAAMVATVTDAYPTRPWCRREAALARTPRPIDGAPCADDGVPRVWAVQPVVAVHQPGAAWVRGLPMLAGVPRIGWDERCPDEITAQIVDRLVLEMLLAHTHRRVALALARALAVQQPGLCWITWVPDTWTLIALRDQLTDRPVQRVIYPGHGLSTAEVDELKPALHTFGKDVELTTYEEM
jgi:hypothetical protein